MSSTFTFIKQSTIVTLILFLLFAGLLAILAVLSWVTWEFVGEWLGRIGLITLLLLALTNAIALLTGLLQR